MDTLTILPVLLFSVILHEVAHGWVALRAGDPTARDSGRLTLNPIPHIDLVGSIIVPLFSLLMAGRIFIAWAKPVPVNPLNYDHPRRDDILVSAAGPLTNILLSLLCAVLAALIGHIAIRIVNPSALTADLLNFLFQMFLGGITLNVVLAVFNLIPVPPLDGSHILSAFLPPQAADTYQRVGFSGVFLLLFLMSLPLFSGIFHTVVDFFSIPAALLYHTLAP